MAVKQRKGKKSASAVSTKESKSTYNADKDKPKRGKMDKRKVPQKSRRKKLTLGSLLLFLSVIISIAGGVLYYFYRRYGPAMLLGQNWKDYNWTPYEWRKFIDDNDKTILLIGGPHRSGTTILWEGIKAHPEIVGFGDTFETGVDYSEGVLMQEVYPRFGVGLEFKKNFGSAMKASGEDDETSDGIGRYALVPSVHWTKENKSFKLEDSSNLSKLLNRFGPYWDKNSKFKSDGMMKAKVWVEKSPQNGVLSTFLEGLYNMPVKEDGSVDLSNTGAMGSKRSVTKFIYATRHPIYNVYATDKFVRESMGGYIDFEILLRNYIQLHKYMKMDEEALESPVMWAHLEDFTSNPSKVLKEIYDFVDVSSDDATIANVLKSIRPVHSNPNEKYRAQWCQHGIQKHGHLIEKYADDLKALDLGYDMDVCN